MLRVAYEEGEAEILAAVLACACSYESIAKKMILTKPDAVNDTFYGDWIKSYLSDAYSTNNRILLETLNTLTGNFTEVQLKHLAEIFINCSLYELAFWEMSWNDR